MMKTNLKEIHQHKNKIENQTASWHNSSLNSFHPVQHHKAVSNTQLTCKMRTENECILSFHFVPQLNKSSVRPWKREVHVTTLNHSVGGRMRLDFSFHRKTRAAACLEVLDYFAPDKSHAEQLSIHHEHYCSCYPRCAWPIRGSWLYTDWHLAITLLMHACGNYSDRRWAVHNTAKASTSLGEQGAVWRGIFGKLEGGK